MKQQPPTLTANLAQSEEALTISWSFVNGAPEGLYVCVRTSVDNEPSAAPYTYLRENDAVLAVTFRRMPIPPGRYIYAPIVPFYRLLDAGQTNQETCVVPLPARELHAYAEPEYPEKPALVRVAKIVFSVEYFWRKDVHFSSAAENDPTVFRAGGGGLTLVEKELQLDRPITVLKRTDNFFRPAS